MNWFCLGPVAMAVGLTMLGWSIYYRYRMQYLMAELSKAQAIIQEAFAQSDGSNREMARILEAKGVARVEWADDGYPLEVAIPVGDIEPGERICRFRYRQKVDVPTPPTGGRG